MLKGIPSILSPELLKVLCEMGHSDRIVIADGNFPVESMGKNAKVVRLDGHGVPEILDAILQVFPLDTYASDNALRHKLDSDIAINSRLNGPGVNRAFAGIRRQLAEQGALRSAAHHMDYRIFFSRTLFDLFQRHTVFQRKAFIDAAHQLALCLRYRLAGTFTEFPDSARHIS